MSFDIDLGSKLVVLIYMVMNFLQAEMIGGIGLLRHSFMNELL